MKNRSRTILRFLLVLTLCFSMIVPFETSLASSKLLTVSFIDVGQGDCILLQYGSSNVMIDSGYESEYPNVSSFMTEKKIKSLDAIIITHPHSDHNGCVPELLRDYNIKRVYMTSYPSTTTEHKEVLKAIKKYKVKRVNVKKGSKIPIGALKAMVLSADTDSEDVNESSIVLKLTYDENSFLFTGDATAKIENEVAAAYDIDVDVLKVAHHGSSYSSPVLYLKEVSPEYAIISVGENNYGHPDKTILKRLNKYANTTLRTDKVGSITVTSDGKILSCTAAEEAEKNQANENTTEYTVIGNVNSKKYHSPSCKSLPSEKNRSYFQSASEAEEAGYTACKLCH